MIYAFFGGTFDPPHLSHVLACLWALETGQVDRVLVVPCGQHAFGKRIHASFPHRLAMCQRAMQRLAADVEVLDIEGRGEGITYTVDTLKTLVQQRPGHSWRLLVGSDILESKEKWKHWSEVERIAPPLVIPRLPGEGPVLSDASDLRSLSSTSLRALLARGDEVPAGLIPATVLDYIRKYCLYST